MNFKLENINLYSFDLNQYNSHASKLEFTLFANYEGKTYFTFLDIDCYGLDWQNGKWHIPSKYLKGYKEYGALFIEQYLVKNEEKQHELF